MIEVSLRVEPDEHNIVNGIDVANMMIREALERLAAYVDESPDLMAALFVRLATDALRDLHCKRLSGHTIGGFVDASQEEATADDRIRQHLKANRERLLAMLGVVKDRVH